MNLPKSVLCKHYRIPFQLGNFKKGSFVKAIHVTYKLAAIGVRHPKGTIIPGDTNGQIDIFLHDRQTGETTRVNVASDGSQANDLSRWPSISANGQFIAFDSNASTLVVSDTNGAKDIFVHDRQMGETTLVSVSFDGEQGNGGSYCPDISGDGLFLAFSSGASNLVPSDTNSTGDVFLIELGPNQAPSQPSNLLPSNGSTGVSLTPTLQSSAFSDPDVGDTLAASQWQIRASSGSYASPVFDNTIISNLTSITVSPGNLNSNNTYYRYLLARI